MGDDSQMTVIKAAFIAGLISNPLLAVIDMIVATSGAKLYLLSLIPKLCYFFLMFIFFILTIKSVQKYENEGKVLFIVVLLLLISIIQILITTFDQKNFWDVKNTLPTTTPWISLVLATISGFISALALFLKLGSDLKDD